MLKRCPGAKDLVEPKITVRTCPACGEEVEFLGYETEAKRYNCGRMLYKEATPSCVTSRIRIEMHRRSKRTKTHNPSRAKELEK